MKIIYNGPYPSVTTKKGDVTFPKGKPVEVDAERGKRLVRQPDFSEQREVHHPKPSSTTAKEEK